MRRTDHLSTVFHMPSHQLLVPDFMHPMRTVGVIGCGIMGGSIALAAARADLDVVVYDVNEDTRILATQAGLRVAATPAEACRNRDLVVIATPVDQISTLVPMIKPYLEPDTVVTEIGSVKSATRGIVEALSSSRVSVVPCHPMAGSERFGFANSNPEMLRGCTWLVCPTTSTSAASRLAAFIDLLEAGRVLTCPLDAHDTVVAVVSHLPQLTASLLAATIGGAERSYANGALAAAGGGFRDTTRIADSSLTMWAPVLEGNRTLLATLLDELSDRATAISAALRRGDMASVEELFKDAHATREAWRRTLPSESATSEKATLEHTPWRDPQTGASAWLDRSLGWETVRTSVEDPAEHAEVSARFLAAMLNLQVPPAITSPGQNFKAVAAALRTAGADVTERETWTADGLPVKGVMLENRFIVLT